LNALPPENGRTLTSVTRSALSAEEIRCRKLIQAADLSTKRRTPVSRPKAQVVRFAWQSWIVGSPLTQSVGQASLSVNTDPIHNSMVDPPIPNTLEFFLDRIWPITDALFVRTLTHKLRADGTTSTEFKQVEFLKPNHNCAEHHGLDSALILAAASA
jgi:hypothetical protein